MPSNKDKVASYLETDEVQALDRFCKEKECSRSQGVAYLIQEKLINDRGRELKLAYSEEINRELKVLRDDVDFAFKVRTGMCSTLDKQSELIAELQEDVCRLKAEVKAIPPQYFTDDEIASVTGRRLQDVYDWRLGARKPRGKRVLEKLKPYEIVDGQWRKKSM